EDEAGLREDVVGVGAVWQQGQDVGVDAPLVLQEQAQEQPGLVHRRRPLAGERLGPNRGDPEGGDHASLRTASPRRRGGERFCLSTREVDEGWENWKGKIGGEGAIRVAVGARGFPGETWRRNPLLI